MPTISHNLLSVHRLASDNNCSKTFNSNGYLIQDKTRQTLLSGLLRYYVSFINEFFRFYWIFQCVTNLKYSLSLHSLKLWFKINIITKFIFSESMEKEITSTIFFQTFLAQHGISHQVSCPYSPEQNGKHHHFIETTCILLLEANLPHFLWLDTPLTAS